MRVLSLIFELLNRNRLGEVFNQQLKYLSSQNKLIIMNSEDKSSDLIDNKHSNSDSNDTYAAVLCKAISMSNDSSNNNFNSVPNNSNQNETLEKSTDQDIDHKESQNNHSNSSEISKTDSFDDPKSSDSFASVKELNNLNLPSINNSASNNAPNISSVKIDSEQSDEKQTSGDFSDSGEESDLEDEADELGEHDLYPTALKWRFRPNIAEKDLPQTVSVLTTSHGSKIFLVGTAHFSSESQEDVSKTIKAVQPDVVLIELCKSRVNILSLDEATILEESKNMNFQKIKLAIEQNGLLQGILYLLLLSMSAHLTKQLGMAPGGEFRRAFAEAKQVPGCLVHLGDRPIHITLQRALATLNWWQKLHIAWYMLRSKNPISKEEVEKCKQKDLLEEMLAEMTGEFPELSRVFVQERDIYLAYSLQMSALPVPSPHSQEVCAPSHVVGVVGIGHVPGIIENWGKVTEKDIIPILNVPEPSLSSKVIRKTIQYSLYGLGAYGIYKLFPKSLLPQTLQNYASFNALPFVHRTT